MNKKESKKRNPKNTKESSCDCSFFFYWRECHVSGCTEDNALKIWMKRLAFFFFQRWCLPISYAKHPSKWECRTKLRTKKKEECHAELSDPLFSSLSSKFNHSTNVRTGNLERACLISGKKKKKYKRHADKALRSWTNWASIGIQWGRGHCAVFSTTTSKASDMEHVHTQIKRKNEIDQSYTRFTQYLIDTSFAGKLYQVKLNVTRYDYGTWYSPKLLSKKLLICIAFE